MDVSDPFTYLGLKRGILRQLLLLEPPPPFPDTFRTYRIRADQTNPRSHHRRPESDGYVPRWIARAKLWLYVFALGSYRAIQLRRIQLRYLRLDRV